MCNRGVQDVEPARTRPFLDPMVIALLAIAALLTWWQVLARPSPPPPSKAGPESRAMEMQWALVSAFDDALRGLLPKTDDTLLQRLQQMPGARLPKPSKKPHGNPWDNAVEAVIRFEGGRPDEAMGRLAHSPEGAFRACWEAAYGQGPAPADAERKEAMRGLGGGLAARLLDAALEKSAGGDSEDARKSAVGHYRRKAYLLSAASLLAFALAAAGLAVGVWMLVRRAGFAGLAGAAPAYRMSGTMAVRIFLVWYIAFLASGTAAAWVGAAVPLGPFALPFAYILHSACALGLVCWAEGVSLAALWRRIAPKGNRWLKDGLKYYLVAIPCCLLLALAMRPFLPEGGPPQKDLMDVVAGANGVVPFAVLFGTIALLGPAFEEVFFRGFLLPVMRRGLSPAAAILLVGALFGAVHLLPIAFPQLVALGSLLGLAFLATRDIRVTILVHACWNGGVFLFQRLLGG